MVHVIGVPLEDLTIEERRSVRIKAAQYLLTKYCKDYNADPADVLVRDALEATPTDANVPDFRDIAQRTAVVVGPPGSAFWGQAAADLVANTLSRVTSATIAVKDKTLIGIYGFLDNSAVLDLNAMRYLRGRETLLFVTPQQVHGNLTSLSSSGKMMGMMFIDIDQPQLTPGVLVWKEGQIVGIEQSHRAAAARDVVQFALVAEIAGEQAKTGNTV